VKDDNYPDGLFDCVSFLNCNCNEIGRRKTAQV